MKTSKIVNFLTMIVILIMTGCSLFDKPSSEKNVADWGDDPVEEIVVPQVVEKIVKEVRYEPAYFDGDEESSYWFVYAKEHGQGVYWNDYQKHPAPYFMPSECFRQLKGRSDKQFFLIHFIQISEGTYEDAVNNNID